MSYVDNHMGSMIDFAIKIPNARHANTWCLLDDNFNCCYQLMFSGGKICSSRQLRLPYQSLKWKSICFFVCLLSGFLFLLLFCKKVITRQTICNMNKGNKERK